MRKSDSKYITLKPLRKWVASAYHGLMSYFYESLLRSHHRNILFSVPHGDNCVLRSPSYISNYSNICLGTQVYINHGLVALSYAEISIGDYTMLGPGVMLLTSGHDPALSGKNFSASRIISPIKVGKNCWIGAGAIVVPGITIGDGAIVGAGSVVIKDVPPWTIVAGNPARILKPRVLNDSTDHEL